MDRDLLFDVRLQPRFLARKVLSPEDLEAYLQNLPDASENVANPEALNPLEASENGPSAEKTQKGSRKR